MTNARLTCGAASFRTASHLPPIEGSKLVNPVTLPPGRARLATKPPPTGSPTATNTTGTFPSIGMIAESARLVNTMMTSGENASSSSAPLRIVFGSPSHQRTSMSALPPFHHPNSSRRFMKAVREALVGPVASEPISTPMRTVRLVCCPRAATGHAAAPRTGIFSFFV